MNIEFLTFLRREIYRFMVLYKQTIVPALLSSLLYILVFGEALGNRIGPLEGTSYMSYMSRFSNDVCNNSILPK